MVIQIKLHSNSMNQSIVLSNQDITIIGRGFFECHDKRVSKKHGEITVIDTTIKVKSCHQNPIFYILKDDPTKKILLKDSEIILGDSDKFSLLPDEFEWTIKVEQENEQNSAPTFRIRQTDEINANLTQLLKGESDEIERTPSPDNLRRPETFENENASRKRSCDNLNDSESSNAKKMKQVSSSQVPSSTTSENQEASNSNPVNSSESCSAAIKPDPDSTDAAVPNSTDSKPSTSAVKLEPVDPTDEPTSSCSNKADTKVDPNAVKTENADNTSSNVRPSCEFGILCYRQTDDHRRDFAHPQDCDYRRPNLPPAPFNSPRCPYWAACYRRNPDHFREMAHPAFDQYTTQRPPQIRVQIQQVIPIPRNNQDEFDEESDVDMFDIDGDDSDVDRDYEIDQSQSTADDEEDFEDEENNLEE